MRGLGLDMGTGSSAGSKIRGAPADLHQVDQGYHDEEGKDAHRDGGGPEAGVQLLVRLVVSDAEEADSLTLAVRVYP